MLMKMTKALRDLTSVKEKANPVQHSLTLICTVHSEISEIHLSRAAIHGHA